MADIGSIMRFLDERKRTVYPNALVFGVPFVGELILAFTQENYPFAYTPASIVSQNMLNRAMFNNFESAMEYRHHEESGSFDVDSAEMQGYIDSIALYIASCFARENNIPELFMADAPNILPQYANLPVEVQARSSRFILENARWATTELLPSDLEDGKRFMASLIRRVEGQVSNPPYQRGAQTARDTLCLYVDIIQAFLAGRFG